MRRISALLLFAFIIYGLKAVGQNDGGVSIGKGDTPANSKAILELVSSNKGLLVTRMTTDQRNAMFNGTDVSAKGLLVFDNTLNAFYFWDGSGWKPISSANIKTISEPPTYNGMAGEMVFDAKSSCLYIYSGGSWFNLSALKTVDAFEVKNVRNTSVGLYSDDVQSALWELADKVKILSNPAVGGMIAVSRDLSLTGNGTPALPLGIANEGIGTSHLGASAVTEDKIANNAVTVDKIRGGGNDKVLTTNGSGTTMWIDKSSFGGATSGQSLILDGTLSGTGTASNPLKISSQNASSGAVLQWSANTILGWVPSKIRPVNIEGVIGDGELNQSLVSNGYGGFKWRTIDASGGSTEIIDGAVSTQKLANSAVTSAKIADGTIQGNNISSMGATSGQVLQWNGSIWIPATVSSGGTNYVLPTATATTLGGVRVGDNLSIDANGVLSASSVLPTATATTLGGVKVGNNLTIDANGILSASNDLPTATATTLGGIKVGNNLTIDANGILSADEAETISLAGEDYLSISGSSITANKVDLGTSVTGTLSANNLPVLTGEVTTTPGSTSTTIADGVVTTAKIADGTILSSDLNQMGATNGQVLQWNSGTSSWSPTTVSAGTPYVLSTASATTLGGIRVGDNLSIDANGVLSASSVLPTATATTLGGVKVGNNLSIDANGVLSASSVLPTATATTLGGVKVGNNLTIDANGILSADEAETISLTGEDYLSISGSSITANKVDLGTSVTGTLSANNLPVLTGEVTTTPGSTSTTISDGVVTTAKIADGTILSSDLNQMGATNGQVLQWNSGTSSWSPATSGGDADSDPSNEIELPQVTGNGNKVLAVNPTGTAVQWINNSISTDASMTGDGTATSPLGINKANIPLSDFASAINDISLGSKKITNLATPTNNTDAATKKYVDDLVGAGGGGDMLKITYDQANIAEQMVGINATQTLTNKTLTSPVINSPTGLTKNDVGLSNVTNNAQIYSLGGLTAQVQTFATGTTGTAPAFNSATSTHTLNIPMASGTGVTAGLISKTEYDLFNSKASAGATFTLGSTSVALGSTTTTIAGLTSVTSTGFTGALTGNASTATNLAGASTGGEILYQSGNNVTSRLPAGTSGQVLTSGGSGAPSWTSAGTGDMTLAGVQTVTGAKTFGAAGNVGKLILAGSTTGSTILNAAVNASGTAVLPAAGGTLATLAGTETLTNKTLTSPVINSPTGLTKNDVGLSNVTNESKATMFTSPAFTGVPTAPTATVGTNTTQIATTAFVAAAMSASSGDITAVTAGTGLTGGALTGDATLSLATSGVTSGNYTSANITVDSYGRITAAANGTGGGGGGGFASTTLTAPVTIDQSNNNVTFTTGDAGRTIVNGSIEFGGATYISSYKIITDNPASYSLTVDAKDYLYIFVTDPPVSGVITLPQPNTVAAGRLLCIKNNTTKSMKIMPIRVNGTGAAQEVNITANKATYVFSDGSGFWYNIGL